MYKGVNFLLPKHLIHVVLSVLKSLKMIECSKNLYTYLKLNIGVRTVNFIKILHNLPKRLYEKNNSDLKFF